MEKICFIVSSPMTVKAFLQDHIRKLSEDFDVTVIANFQDKKELDFLDKSVKIHSIPINRKIGFLSDIKAFIALWSFLKRCKFHAVHSVTPKAGLLAMSAGFFAGVKYRFHTFTGQVWVTQSGFKRLILKNTDKLTFTFATFAFVDSLSQLNFLLREGITSSNKSMVLADGSISGVDTKRFAILPDIRRIVRTELGISDGSVVFLFLGRLNIDKGVLDLAVAFKKIATSSTTLLIVGPDEDSIKEKMLELLDEQREKIIFIDYTDRPENYMNAADVFCLPSYREGFGSVIIEAAAVGIPAIGSDVYGISDAIVNKETGLLHKVKDIDDIAEKMAELADNSVLRIFLGKQAQERAKQIFTKERLSDALSKEYKKLLLKQ